jgi:hypothetical protein
LAKTVRKHFAFYDFSAMIKIKYMEALTILKLPDIFVEKTTTPPTNGSSKRKPREYTLEYF